MYMYLSDRIRRMFLSGACPQNISPKKPLSLKDQRFLQKTKDDNNLSRILLKQQKLLYEKHIGLLLEEKKADANINRKKTNSFFLEKTKNKLDTLFSQNSEGLFVLNIKVQKKKQEGFFDIVCSSKKKPVNKAPKSSVLLEKSKSLDIDKQSNGTTKTKGATPCTGDLDNPFVHNARYTPKGKPLFINNESSYTNFRYLYDHESLKTSIVPQIFKNQKPISRAKTLLHERKKIALLYGQLAKKDIINISRKALSTPGFFEDNMFTLLESRVDVCVFRAGFSKTIAGARQLIRNGSVLVNGQKIFSCKRKAKPGDYFSFTNKQELLNPYRSTTLELYSLYLSSNLLRDPLSLNKIRFLLEVTFKHQYPLTGIETKKNKTLSTVPEWLLLLFFGLPCKKKQQGFCFSLYWGFFFYKIKKMPVLSCFFEQKKKASKEFNAFEKERVKGMITNPLEVSNRLKSRDFWHKGKKQAVDTLFIKKLGQGELPEITRTPFKTNQYTKSEITHVPRAGLNVPLILQTKLHLHALKEPVLAPEKASSCEFQKSNCYESQNLYKASSKNDLIVAESKPLEQEKTITSKVLKKHGLFKDSPEEHVWNGIAWLNCMAQCFSFEKKNKRNASGNSCSAFIKKKGVIFLNLYTQLLLKKQQKEKAKKDPCSTRVSNASALMGHPNTQHLFFRKKIPSSNLWAIWGQKPLHLEISHKTGGFIYMYKPQKMISPVCLDFKP